MTSILLPQFKSAYRCCSQRRAPDRATKALASMTPAVRVKSALMEEERTISSLSPVARTAIPGRVKKKTLKAATRITTITPVNRKTCALESRYGD